MTKDKKIKDKDATSIQFMAFISPLKDKPGVFYLSSCQSFEYMIRNGHTFYQDPDSQFEKMLRELNDKKLNFITVELESHKKPLRFGRNKIKRIHEKKYLKQNLPTLGGLYVHKKNKIKYYN